MEKLKRLIGLAPSELSPEDLRRKIHLRQELVSGCLQEFRERMSGSRGRAGSGTVEPKVKTSSEGAALIELMAQLKEAGMSIEDFRRIARGGKGK
jgi:hypothetical protein